MFLILRSEYITRKTSGFTLLELLLVVFIMSVLAFSAVSLTETLDSSQDQYRYERAKNQGVDLKKAIVDRVETQQVVRGFVADIGALPATMTELAFGVVDGDPSDVPIPASSLRTPMYDLTPDDDDGLQTPDAAVAVDGQDGIIFLPASLNLVKGFRGTPLQTDEDTPRDFYRGSYLSNLLPGKNIYVGPDKPRFDDGWGNQNGDWDSDLILPTGSNALSLDDRTHGWVWEYQAGTHQVISDGALTIKTYGKDGVSGGTEYADDLVFAAISPDDYSVAESEIQLELHNDLADWNAEIQYRFALLVYYAKENKWRRIISNPLSRPQLGQTSTVTVPGLSRIPAGTHVLLLIQNNFYPQTPMQSVIEETAGTIDNPEVQTYVLSPPAAVNRVKISVTLPDPNDSMTPITGQNATWQSTITTAIEDLNSAFTNSEDAEVGAYTTNPLEVIENIGAITTSGQIAIEVNEASGGDVMQGFDVGEIVITREPVDATHSIRAKHVHVLPGQTNIFRLNLSSNSAVGF
ncbi:MAG: prepilin-type N-terminal cleavage/methylation domain-containing protein [Pirellulales bacterium]|nr:prepilin-type N-terminal cleavage/methylation domain-containing protein [Pirellulales bacterium]